MSASIDEQFIDYIVKSLVGKPDAVSIKRTIDEKGVLLELTVDPEDLGRVIGKRGATAQSLRTLLRALGTKNDARYNLKIVDNGVPRPDRAPREENGTVSEDSWSSEGPAPAAPAEPADSTAEAPEETPVEAEETAPVAAEEAPVEEETRDSNDSVSRTRKELADLDDLDI